MVQEPYPRPRFSGNSSWRANSPPLDIAIVQSLFANDVRNGYDPFRRHELPVIDSRSTYLGASDIHERFLSNGMPRPLRCQECGLTLLGFEARGPTPIDHDECPDCGGTEFAFGGADEEG